MNRRGFFDRLVSASIAAAALIMFPKPAEAKTPEGCRYCHNWTPRPDVMSDSVTKDKFGKSLELGECRIIKLPGTDESRFDRLTWSDDLCSVVSPPRKRIA